MFRIVSRFLLISTEHEVVHENVPTRRKRRGAHQVLRIQSCNSTSSSPGMPMTKKKPTRQPPTPLRHGNDRVQCEARPAERQANGRECPDEESDHEPEDHDQAHQDQVLASFPTAPTNPRATHRRRARARARTRRACGAARPRGRPPHKRWSR